MALSDCPKCWDTPCTCGWQFRDWTVEAMERLVSEWPKDRVERLVEALKGRLK